MSTLVRQRSAVRGIERPWLRADLAELELENLLDGEDQDLAGEVLGVLTATAGPLAIDDLATLASDLTPTTPKCARQVNRLVTVHLRTTNPIESTFATVRLRTKITKGHGSKAAGLAMAFKLIESAHRRWRMVNAPHLVALVRAGATFVNGKLAERPGEDAQPEAA